MLRRVLLWTALAIALVCWLPVIIVLLRPEPGYFTGGIALSALIATMLILAAAAGLTLLWMRTGERARPLLEADSNGIRIPGASGGDETALRWEQLALIRLIGRTDPELAFYPLVEDEPEEPAAGPELDLSEPEYLRPLDFQTDPPPAMSAPPRSAYEAITPLEPTPDSPAEVIAPPRHESLYATTHLVHLTRTDPPLPEILRSIRRLAAGRVPLG